VTGVFEVLSHLEFICANVSHLSAVNSFIMAAVEDSTVDMNYQNPNVKVPPLNIAKTVEKNDEEEHPATCMEKAFMFFGFYAGK